jgi:hypothetical protein
VAGLSLIEMAIAFVNSHPAVTLRDHRPPHHRAPGIPTPTSAPADVLDRIDEIVTPGTLINPADAKYLNPALNPSTRRRT